MKKVFFHSIPIYPLQRVFYPQNLACTPKNDEVPYTLLYIEGTKIRNKTKCTPDFKMQREPCSDSNCDLDLSPIMLKHKLIQGVAIPKICDVISKSTHK